MPARAGSGPPPKDNHRRRNADVYAGHEVTISAAAKVSAPPLPGARGYVTRTRDWYSAWCSSPQAQTFTATDWQRLHMLAPLVDRYFRAPAQGLMAEIRQNESLMGATHADRLRARMKVEKAAPEEVPEGVSQLEEYRQRLAG